MDVLAKIKNVQGYSDEISATLGSNTKNAYIKCPFSPDNIVSTRASINILAPEIYRNMKRNVSSNVKCKMGIASIIKCDGNNIM